MIIIYITLTYNFSLIIIKILRIGITAIFYLFNYW